MATPLGPWLMFTQPVIPKALRAAEMAFDQMLSLARAEARLETILPYLFLIMSQTLRPPTVFNFLPLKTSPLLNRPRAMITFFPLLFMAVLLLGFFITASSCSSLTVTMVGQRQSPVPGCCG
eukprot:CAMPEP_0175798022 /NCGR_PEP_ID=MMETSP0097-20121207/85771_1 /TAXON_ID=311494 /ORGANISM="Alexandrium monilatum, Strain CCMP3105" /LENGTH=121 /DNA_ID=CAMNT_0017109235 /DNA_START=291 /DNA_END=653 /DNA_ORIENTATION=-